MSKALADRVMIEDSLANNGYNIFKIQKWVGQQRHATYRIVLSNGDLVWLKIERKNDYFGSVGREIRVLKELEGEVFAPRLLLHGILEDGRAYFVTANAGICLEWSLKASRIRAIYEALEGLAAVGRKLKRGAHVFTVAEEGGVFSSLPNLTSSLRILTKRIDSTSIYKITDRIIESAGAEQSRLIHGSFTINNILRQGHICSFIDFEVTRMGVGTFDVASLIGSLIDEHRIEDAVAVKRGAFKFGFEDLRRNIDGWLLFRAMNRYESGLLNGETFESYRMLLSM